MCRLPEELPEETSYAIYLPAFLLNPELMSQLLMSPGYDVAGGLLAGRHLARGARRHLARGCLSNLGAFMAQGTTVIGRGPCVRSAAVITANSAGTCCIVFAAASN